jgi:uncharacterized protein (DUF433 family)
VEDGEKNMTPQIINRGRGPEIAGTRITVYRIMDFLRDNSSSERIAAELDLSAEQVQCALDYLAAHPKEVEQEYELILKRVNQPNPTWVDAGRAETIDQLRERLQARGSRDVTHADSSRQ